jgi:hypothetical protein
MPQSGAVNSAKFCVHAETNSSVGVLSKKDLSAAIASSGSVYMKRSPFDLNLGQKIDIELNSIQVLK